MNIQPYAETTETIPSPPHQIYLRINFLRNCSNFFSLSYCSVVLSTLSSLQMAAATITRLHHHHHHVSLLSKAPPLLLIPAFTTTTISPFFCQSQSQSRCQSHFYHSRAFSIIPRRRYGFREEDRSLTRERWGKAWGTSGTRRRAFSGSAKGIFFFRGPFFALCGGRKMREGG